VTSFPLERTSSGGTPFVIAHRFGNSLSALRSAEALGVRAIEADLHLFRGRIEVRHLKTVGPIPLLWDRWKLGNPLARRLVLAELIAAASPDTELVLDLKGRDLRLSARVCASIEPLLAAGGRVTICARSWPLLDPFRGLEGVRLVHSVGTAKQLRQLQRDSAGRRIQGITIHERLLDSATVRDLRELADTIVTWPVNSVERARELIAFGVDGLISDRPAVVQPVAGGAG
jgi:glycerophosphoryl diester phosphodiesterase